MEMNPMKNMIVLKNLPSNIVEEAFVILKENVKIHTVEIADKKGSKEKRQVSKQDSIIKEAEMLISQYVDSLNEKESKTKNENKKMLDKYKKMKAITIFLSIFSILSTIVLLAGWNIRGKQSLSLFFYVIENFSEIPIA